MNKLIHWLLEGDPSLAYLVARDLLKEDTSQWKEKIGKQGWCAEYIRNRSVEGNWGHRFYQPKWKCTHYTLLELKNLAYPAHDPMIQKEVIRIGLKEIGNDGGINPAVSTQIGETCVSGMYINYAAHFQTPETVLNGVIDFILSQKMDDGGYNCNLNGIGAKHSSLHTSICVLEGFQSYLVNGYTHRREEVEVSMNCIVEFILRHELFKSCKTGNVINEKFFINTYPFRWKYTILRALNCFVDCGVHDDPRMKDAIERIADRRTKEGWWKMQSGYPGQIYFEMEEAGKASRMITYLALKVLQQYRGLEIIA